MMADKPFRLDRRHLEPVDGETTFNQPGTYLVDQLIVWQEFWAHDHGSEEWLAWPLIPAHRQTALYAPAKTGKSIIALAVCAALAAGRPILGQSAQPPRHVLYLDYEMTAGDLQERLEALGYSAEDDLSHLHYALLPSLPPLNTTLGAVAVCALAKDCDAELVVIDTMGRAVDVGDENSSTAYQEFARTTGLALKAAGRAVLRTDHAGKERDRGQRGSSAKNDDVDVVLRIDAAEGGWVLTRTHTRIAWVPEKVAISILEQPDGTTELVVTKEPRTYVVGTKDLADLLRTLGATGITTRRQASDLLAATGEKARTKRVSDALAWIRAETPTFHSGTTQTEPGTTPPPVPPKSAGTTESSIEETPGHSDGNHDGNHWEPREQVNGNQGGPHSGPLGPNLEPDYPDLDF